MKSSASPLRSAALVLMLPLASLLATGCDPGRAPASPAPSAATSPAATPKGSPALSPSGSATPASAVQELRGDYDYDQVVSLDDPDGPATPLTFVVTTERKLAGLRASVSGDALAKLQLDFSAQSLIAVVAPGGEDPEIVSLERGDGGVVVRYRAPAAKDGARARRGRLVARVVSPPLGAEVRFERVVD